MGCWPLAIGLQCSVGQTRVSALLVFSLLGNLFAGGLGLPFPGLEDPAAAASGRGQARGAGAGFGRGQRYSPAPLLHGPPAATNAGVLSPETLS